MHNNLSAGINTETKQRKSNNRTMSDILEIQKCTSLVPFFDGMLFLLTPDIGLVLPDGGRVFTFIVLWVTEVGLEFKPTFKLVSSLKLLLAGFLPEGGRGTRSFGWRVCPFDRLVEGVHVPSPVIISFPILILFSVVVVRSLLKIKKNKVQHNRKQKQSLFFLIYCKNITNFLFWVIWTCLVTSIKTLMST